MGGAFRHPVDRRTFLRRVAALSAAAWATPLVGTAGREAWARTRDTAVAPAGTTLERSITTRGSGPYFRLGYGPGWPILVRDELATPKPGRESRRRALATLLHLTDFQLVDAQSPARVEFVDREADEPAPDVVAAAQRPQEALICHVVEALMRQVRSVKRGPVTGRDLDCVVSTGDNVDNTQRNELRWYLTLLDGGRLAANSGAADVFEGVQAFDDPAFYDPHYWHPEEVGDPRAPDVYKRSFGFPDYPGLLDAAIRPFDAVGATTRWYSVFGNHDALVQGNAPRNEAFDRIAQGDTKVLAPPPGMSYGDLLRGLEQQDPAAFAALSAAPARPVAPDAERHLVTAEEYIRAHLDSPGQPGPVGHGFTQDNLDRGTLYYTFSVAEGILGITLDTTAPYSAEGTIGQSQWDWLTTQLVAAHHRYYDEAGNEVRTDHDDRLVVLFTHHRPPDIQPIPGPDSSGNVEQRHSGDELVALLHRFPNVVLWVNGHSHFNRIVAHPDPSGRTGGFWDLTTSAQIDPPQQARVLELVDNRDGTLSIFTTIVDHAGPVDTEAGRYDLLGLAGIGRELAYNDYQSDVVNKIGTPTDHNTELVVAAPFTLRSTGAPAAAPTGGPAGDGAQGADTPASAQAPLPTTGGGIGAAALVAAAAGAMALRRRGQGRDA